MSYRHASDFPHFVAVAFLIFKPAANHALNEALEVAWNGYCSCYTSRMIYENVKSNKKEIGAFGYRAVGGCLVGGPAADRFDDEH